MKHFCRLLLLGTIVLFLTECKKGDDDPSISLRSRKARLAGAWRLVGGSASITTTGYNESYRFDGTDIRLNITGHTGITYVGKYTLDLRIEKDGSFKFREDYVSEILEASGTWNFNTGTGEDKNKEAVIFTINDVIKGYTYGYNMFNRFNVSFIYKIKELRNKRLVINSGGKYYSDKNGNYVTLSTDYIFELRSNQ